MNTHPITRHTANKYKAAVADFEEALYDSMLLYSLRHLAFTGHAPTQSMLDTLQKALQVCYLAGINSKQHFKQIYVFDVNTGQLYVDWLMSKKGFNLMVMQSPSLNHDMARWLWELTI
jgi:hypothetical protein